jgi:dTDP-4-amino-4,6-dideoxygalactose transaminase
VSRIYLSPPDVGSAERDAVVAAIDSGWVAPVGPDLEAFERELATRAGRAHAVALSSGTAAMHLALITLGVGTGAEVVVPTLTFVATANVVRYVGAVPVFVDSEEQSWNLDPELLDDLLANRRRNGQPPAAVFAVDLYGNTASYDRITEICLRHGVPLLEDSAEALGATHRNHAAGSFGIAGAFSFNGNKIITTSAGGALVTDDEAMARQVRHLATQAREPTLHYEHTQLGFNYRMSNLLAAVGRAQLGGLDRRIRYRAEVEGRYRDALGSIDGLDFIPRPSWGTTNHWLTCATIEPALTGATRDDVIAALEQENIESRPAWKPMHRQPLYKDAAAVLSGVADRVFDLGLCLPSGSNLDTADQDRVINIVGRTLGAWTGR